MRTKNLPRSGKGFVAKALTAKPGKRVIEKTLDHFEDLSRETGIPTKILFQLYMMECCLVNRTLY